MGQLKRTSLARFYALHHVGVFPSIHPEAFGIVAAEMMASGLAVVSSCVGGAGELIKHRETGLAFQPNNYQGLSACLKELARDSKLNKKIAREGKILIREKFSVENSARELEIGFNQ